MSCQDFQEQVFDFVDGALPEDVHEKLDQHLAACEGCRGLLAEHRRLGGELCAALRKTTETLTLDPEVRNRVLSTLSTGNHKIQDPSAIGEDGPRTFVEPARVASLWISLARHWAAIAACVLAVAAVIGTRWFEFRKFELPKTHTAALNMTVSVRVPHVLTTYTFHNDGQFITDALITESSIVHETLWADHQSHTKKTANETSL